MCDTQTWWPPAIMTPVLSGVWTDDFLSTVSRRRVSADQIETVFVPGCKRVYLLL